MRDGRPIIIALALCTVGRVSAFPVAVPNGSFESADPARPELPRGYSTYVSPGTTAQFAWDRTVAHTGRASVRIESRGPQTALWQLSGVTCLPGLRYRLRVWVKTREAKGQVGLAVRYRDARGWVSSPMMQPDAPSGATRDWTELTYWSQAPGAAISMVVFLSNREGAGGTVWFDDLSLDDDLDEVVTARLPEMLDRLAWAASPAAKAVPERVKPAEAADWAKRGAALLERVRPLRGKVVEEAERRVMAGEWTAILAYYRGVERELGLARLTAEWGRVTNQVAPDLLLGWQDDVTRVWPRQVATSFHPARRWRVLAVKGEVAAAQLVVAAPSQALRAVRIEAGELRSEAGRIAAEQVTISPIAAVQVTRPDLSTFYPLEVMEPVWCPEILLPNHSFEVAAGDSQPVWISVAVPRSAAPGSYVCPMTVRSDGAQPQDLFLEVEVADVALPETWHFRNILSFHDGWCREFYGDRWTPELRAKFLDFLLDRRLALASMYGNQEFTWDEICRGMARGQNLILVCTLDPTAGLTEPPYLKPNVEQAARRLLDDWVPRLKERGWLGKGYLYGFDERPKELFQAVGETFARFRRDYGLQTITTAYDYSYGLDTGLTGKVDHFMPEMSRYNPERAAEARARGTRVWWYTTTWNVEQHLVRSRLIPWMTWRVGADGFLIWCLNRWRGEGAPKVPRAEWKTNREPVKMALFNEWDPYLDGVTPNSSANYVYPGEHGPLSSLRLEAFRDGIEDYDLLALAAERLAALKPTDPRRKVLQAALSLDDAFVKDAVQYSVAPADLHAHRERLIRALEATN